MKRILLVLAAVAIVAACVGQGSAYDWDHFTSDRYFKTQTWELNGTATTDVLPDSSNQGSLASTASATLNMTTTGLTTGVSQGTFYDYYSAPHTGFVLTGHYTPYTIAPGSVPTAEVVSTFSIPQVSSGGEGHVQVIANLMPSFDISTTEGQNRLGYGIETKVLYGGTTYWAADNWTASLVNGLIQVKLDFPGTGGIPNITDNPLVVTFGSRLMQGDSVSIDSVTINTVPETGYGRHVDRRRHGLAWLGWPVAGSTSKWHIKLQIMHEK